jgi:hypothetical protein
LVAALRVILDDTDQIHKENFLRVVLPKSLFDSARAKAYEKHRPLLAHLERMARGLPRGNADRSKIWRGLYALRNLKALGSVHKNISELTNELLAQRVGEYRTILEDIQEDLSDPAENEEVQILAARLQNALDLGSPVWIPRLSGLEIALKQMLIDQGFNRVELGAVPSPDAVSVGASDCRSLGIGLGLFKALQLINGSGFVNQFLDFTAIDIETTDKDVTLAELVEIAAVKVRNGLVVDEYWSLVKPRVPITTGARAKHNIQDSQLEDAPYFEYIWPSFRAF